jgi:thiosulfate/3-mercaptopyruvate sulfurtransferase
MSPPMHFQVKKDESLRKSADDVMETFNSTTRLLDVRPRDEFVGETSFARMTGHIPGAVNLPIENLIAPDGTLHSEDRLIEEFARVEIDATVPEVIVYDNFGVDSCVALIALQMAGITTGSLYDGSWVEWGNDGQRPVVQGGEAAAAAG